VFGMGCWWRAKFVFVLIASMCLSFAPAFAAQFPPMTPEQLVRETVANEVKAGQDGLHFMFRNRKETPAGSQTRLLVQTSQAMARLIIANNDRPLSPQERSAEEQRLIFLASNPEELRRKQQKEKEDADRVARIVRALPDAFVYEYAATETGRPGVGKPGDELVRLKFRPNPKYNPPTRVEQVLTGMMGTLLIDSTSKRIANIDGTLFKDVSFGWGILGHLDKGGEFQVDQGEVGQGAYEVTRMRLNFTGKLLLFKGIVIKFTEVYSNFQPVPPNLTFAQAIELLKQQDVPVAKQTSQPTKR
jgi:hypothetical protein